MMLQPLHPRPRLPLLDVGLILLLLGAFWLLADDLQQMDQLQGRLTQQVASPVKRRGLASERNVSRVPQTNMLSQLDRLARSLPPEVYLLQLQVNDHGAIRLRITSTQHEQAFAFVDRLRADGWPATILDTQQSAPGSGLAVESTIAIESKK